MKKAFVVTAATVLLCLGSLAQGAAKYAITDLGDLGGGTSQAYGINSAGQVVGRSITSLGETRSFIWDRQTGMQDLGVLGGYGGEAYGINDEGQVVGIAYTAGHAGPNDGQYHAFVWSNSDGMQELDALYSGVGSCAWAINSSGQVAGASLTPDGDIRGVVWDGIGGIQEVGTLGGDYSEAFAINDTGQVVGRAGLLGATLPSQAFIWDCVAGIRPVGPSYGPSGSTSYAINELGCVAGAFRIDGGIRAFRWTETGGMEDIGGPTGQLGVWGEATDINDSGLVVGWSKLSDSDVHALLWDGDGQMSDLNDLLDESGGGWTLEFARSVNNLGQIVGAGSHYGVSRAFLLDPVPEPSSLLLLGSGVLATTGMIRRKR